MTNRLYGIRRNGVSLVNDYTDTFLTFTLLVSICILVVNGNFSTVLKLNVFFLLIVVFSFCLKGEIIFYCVSNEDTRISWNRFCILAIVPRRGVFDSWHCPFNDFANYFLQNINEMLMQKPEGKIWKSFSLRKVGIAVHVCGACVQRIAVGFTNIQ